MYFPRSRSPWRLPLGSQYKVMQKQKQQKNYFVSNLKIPIRKSWGQNFIIDKNTINKIVRIIRPKENDHIIEIGPGRGAITIPIFS